jgi:hypothetical protein
LRRGAGLALGDAGGDGLGGEPAPDALRLASFAFCVVGPPLFVRK